MPDTPRSLSTDSERVLEMFRGDYANLQYHFVEFIAEHLSDCSRVFDGDLQQVLILAIIGQLTLRSILEATRKGGRRLPRTSIAAQRIADATGIPRETVRRKLAELSRRGWIERVSGGWRMVVGPHGDAAARVDLDDLNERALARLARFYTFLHRLLPRPSR